MVGKWWLLIVTTWVGVLLEDRTLLDGTFIFFSYIQERIGSSKDELDGHTGMNQLFMTIWDGGNFFPLNFLIQVLTSSQEPWKMYLIK
jgi:hypothetical protein